MKCRPFFCYAPLSMLLACGGSSTTDVPNAGGLCAGCYEFACVISIFPCSQARWALKVAVPCADGERS